MEKAAHSGDLWCCDLKVENQKKESSNVAQNTPVAVMIPEGLLGKHDGVSGKKNV